MSSSNQSQKSDSEQQTEQPKVICKICFEQFSEHVRPPISLNCGHTFCLVCTRRLGRNRRTIQCGICRRNTYSDPSKLGKNIVLMELLEATNTLGEDQPLEEEEEAGQQNEYRGASQFIARENLEEAYEEIEWNMSMVTQFVHLPADRRPYMQQIIEFQSDLAAVETQMNCSAAKFNTITEQLQQLHEALNQHIQENEPQSSSSTRNLEGFFNGGFSGRFVPASRPVLRPTFAGPSFGSRQRPVPASNNTLGFSAAAFPTAAVNDSWTSDDENSSDWNRNTRPHSLSISFSDLVSQIADSNPWSDDNPTAATESTNAFNTNNSGWGSQPTTNAGFGDAFSNGGFGGNDGDGVTNSNEDTGGWGQPSSQSQSNAFSNTGRGVGRNEALGSDDDTGGWGQPNSQIQSSSNNILSSNTRSGAPSSNVRTVGWASANTGSAGWGRGNPSSQTRSSGFSNRGFGGAIISSSGSGSSQPSSSRYSLVPIRDSVSNTWRSNAYLGNRPFETRPFRRAPRERVVPRVIQLGEPCSMPSPPDETPHLWESSDGWGTDNENEEAGQGELASASTEQSGVHEQQSQQSLEQPHQQEEEGNVNNQQNSMEAANGPQNINGNDISPAAQVVTVEAKEERHPSADYDSDPDFGSFLGWESSEEENENDDWPNYLQPPTFEYQQQPMEQEEEESLHSSTNENGSSQPVEKEEEDEEAEEDVQRCHVQEEEQEEDEEDNDGSLAEEEEAPMEMERSIEEQMEEDIPHEKSEEGSEEGDKNSSVWDSQEEIDKENLNISPEVPECVVEAQQHDLPGDVSSSDWGDEEEAEDRTKSQPEMTLRDQQEIRNLTASPVQSYWSSSEDEEEFGGDGQGHSSHRYPATEGDAPICIRLGNQKVELERNPSW